MKIYSWNVNGIRSAAEKGLSGFLSKEAPDVLCLQEIKANGAQFPDTILKAGYYLSVNAATKPGYAGVAVFSKEKPREVARKLGHKRFDLEGRILILKFSTFTLINVYMPHGGRKKENLDYKLEVYDLLLKLLEKRQNENVVIAGDFNIAHKEIDLARPSGNKNNIMFTPEERERLDRVLAAGYTDTLREYHTEGGLYTWWPYAFDARNRNVGWRIDYIYTSTKSSKRLHDAWTSPQVLGSDHCPIGVDLT